MWGVYGRAIRRVSAEAPPCERWSLPVMGLSKKVVCVREKYLLSPGLHCQLPYAPAFGGSLDWRYRFCHKSQPEMTKHP